MKTAQSAYAEVLERWTAAGVPVLVLRDTPYATEIKSVPQCIAEHVEKLPACDGSLDRLVEDPLAEAADESSSPLIESVDLTDRICKGDICYSTVGGVIVYFDRGHLSATFSRTLADEIARRAFSLLDRSGTGS